jgi:hypothetical protein
MSCHVILISGQGLLTGQETYQAWCKPCLWESEPFDFKWQAKNAGDKHSGAVEEQHPPWARGPG